MTQSILLPELGTENGLLNDSEIAEILKQKSPNFEKYLNFSNQNTTLIEHIVGNYLTLKHETYESST